MQVSYAPSKSSSGSSSTVSVINLLKCLHATILPSLHALCGEQLSAGVSQGQGVERVMGAKDGWEGEMPVSSTAMSAPAPASSQSAPKLASHTPPAPDSPSVCGVSYVEARATETGVTDATRRSARSFLTSSFVRPTAEKPLTVIE